MDNEGSLRNPEGNGGPQPVAARGPGGRGAGGVSLQLALLGLVAAAFLAGIVPAGLILERWVARELEARVVADLQLAPALLADRNAAVGDALMMHAKELAVAPRLAPAVAAADERLAVEIADSVARALADLPVVVGADGRSWVGPGVPEALLDATRGGEMPVAIVTEGGTLQMLSVAPVVLDGRWLGAAGVVVPLDEAAAGGLAGLARADLVVLRSEDGNAVAAPAGDPRLSSVLASVGPATEPGIGELSIDGRRFLYAAAPMKGATVIFGRDLDRELAILGPLRRVLAATGAGAFALAVLLGAVLARGIGRPVRTLAEAAGGVSRGDFEAPIESSSIREVGKVTDAFREMRAALAVRIAELGAANTMLEERQNRLTALQARLIHREKVAASGRIAAELAHEIRNPVANLRNCLELLRRRLQDDPEGREYAALAVDELLRMHHLAERMLRLNRPRDPAVGECDAAEVAREVAAMSTVGTDGTPAVSVDSPGGVLAAVPPDTLKQILLNLVQNARDAVPEGLEMDISIERDESDVVILVRDNGPGVPEGIRSRIFDPFFTTRATGGGVGLGLFLVDGIVRGYGGTVTVDDAPGGGACFRITLPAVESGSAVLAASGTVDGAAAS